MLINYYIELRTLNKNKKTTLTQTRFFNISNYKNCVFYNRRLCVHTAALFGLIIFYIMTYLLNYFSVIGRLFLLFCIEGTASFKNRYSRSRSVRYEG